MRRNRATVDQLADELANVVITADLIAMELDIDLDDKILMQRLTITICP